MKGDGLLLINVYYFLHPVRKARKSAQTYFHMYMEAEPVSQLVKSTAGVMQEYTQSGGVDRLLLACL